MGYKTHENAMYSQTHNERQKGYVRTNLHKSRAGYGNCCSKRSKNRSKASSTKGRFVPPDVYSTRLLRQEKVVEIPHPPQILPPCDYVSRDSKSTLLGENTKYENTLVQSSSSVSRLYKENTMKLLEIL